MSSYHLISGEFSVRKNSGFTVLKCFEMDETIFINPNSHGEEAESAPSIWKWRLLMGSVPMVPKPFSFSDMPFTQYLAK